MGGKRDACWPFLAIIMLAAMVTMTGCLCGSNSHTVQEAGNADDHATSTDTYNSGSIDSSVPVPSVTPAITVTPMTPPTPRPSAFTISVEGGKDHQPGETVRIYGVDTYSAVLYLFVSGMMAPLDGGQLDDAREPVIDGDPATFAMVNVSADGSWDYEWAVPAGRPALGFDLYNIIAASGPRDKPHLDQAAAWDMVTVKIRQP